MPCVISRLMAHFDKTAMDAEERLSGIFVVSDLPIVFYLSGTLLQHVRCHFIEKGLWEDETNARDVSRKQWYGIMDGVHAHASITNLMRQHQRCKFFKLFVMA